MNRKCQFTRGPLSVNHGGNEREGFMFCLKGTITQRGTLHRDILRSQYVAENYFFACERSFASSAAS